MQQIPKKHATQHYALSYVHQHKVPGPPGQLFRLKCINSERNNKPNSHILNLPAYDVKTTTDHRVPSHHTPHTHMPYNYLPPLFGLASPPFLDEVQSHPAIPDAQNQKNLPGATRYPGPRIKFTVKNFWIHIISSGTGRNSYYWNPG